MFVSFIDDYSCLATVYLINKKTEVPGCFKHYLDSMPIDRKCRFLQSDQGGEYISKEMKRLLQERAIYQETVSSHTSQHNGVAERFNRTIMGMVRCLLEDSGLPKSLWGEALKTSVIINNQLPTSANNGDAPLKRWNDGSARSVFEIHKFGCKASLLVPEDKRTKLDARVRTVVYLGPANERSSHHRVLIDVKVIESS